jgi:hypothetical protein
LYHDFTPFCAPAVFRLIFLPNQYPGRSDGRDIAKKKESSADADLTVEA